MEPWCPTISTLRGRGMGKITLASFNIVRISQSVRTFLSMPKSATVSYIFYRRTISLHVEEDHIPRRQIQHTASSKHELLLYLVDI